MTAPRFAARASALLRRWIGRSGVRQPDATEQARGMATIERAMHAQGRRVGIRRSFAAAVVVAACGLVWVGAGFRASHGGDAAAQVIGVVASARSTGARVVTENGELALSAAVQLDPGSRVDTAEQGTAELQLSSGTELHLSGASALGLKSNRGVQHFVLARGSLRARVSKLEASQRFVVDTPDAQIEVRGTSFELRWLESEHACAPGIRTRLFVSEGAVAVRADQGSALVLQGEHWPAACGRQPAQLAPTSEGDADAVAALEARERPRDADVGEHSTAAEETAAQEAAARNPAKANTERRESSPLSEQSNLFARAARAQRNGESRAALEAYQELLERFPRGALAENALVARMRILAKAGSASAAVEARRYLARFPEGFARQEAERLVR